MRDQENTIAEDLPRQFVGPGQHVSLKSETGAAEDMTWTEIEAMTEAGAMTEALIGIGALLETEASTEIETEAMIGDLRVDEVELAGSDHLS